MLVTVLGIIIEVNPESWNAVIPIDVTPVAITTAAEQLLALTEPDSTWYLPDPGLLLTSTSEIQL
jgi:hypothetical protein